MLRHYVLLEKIIIIDDESVRSLHKLDHVFHFKNEGGGSNKRGSSNVLYWLVIFSNERLCPRMFAAWYSGIEYFVNI